ncbi:hypothetical protein O0I10_006529 [Lichtheimia ornata]|uniref:Uncharacterized protein n=1 Tax=Lichtheimia ornata TaxID=688661 RepID=A0AAD7V1Q6_9FUNG|nr:uncharacterized protein O0I10_006529 [Lichtheimia ornata]KAJ8657714.1 hypothetical protein O0I10_006529 [Lichtheimia ornata]
MPSALQVACRVDNDRPHRRWHPLFFLDWWNGSSSVSEAPTTTPNETNCLDQEDDDLLRICERVERNERALLLLEKSLRGERVDDTLLTSPFSPRSPQPTSHTQQEQTASSPPPPPQPPQPTRPKTTCDVGVQTHQDPRILFYQQQLEAKMDQFNEQEQMITRLQDHLEIVKEQLDEARARAAAATPMDHHHHPYSSSTR